MKKKLSPDEKKRLEIEAAARKVFKVKGVKRITAADRKAAAKAAKARAKALRGRTISDKVRQDLNVKERAQIRRLFNRYGTTAEKSVARFGAKETLRAGIILRDKLGAKRQSRQTEFWKQNYYRRIDKNNPNSKYELWVNGDLQKGRFSYSVVRRKMFAAKKARYLTEIARVTGHNEKFIKSVVRDIRAEQSRELAKFKRSAKYKRLSAKEKKRFTIQRGTWAVLRTMANLLQIVGTDPKGI